MNITFKEVIPKKINKMLGEVKDVIESYQEIIDESQRSQDFKNLARRLSKLVTKIKTFQEKWNKEHVEVENLDLYFDALVRAMDLYGDILRRRADKAQGIPYGWLQQRRDRKAHAAAQQTYAQFAKGMFRMEDGRAFVNATTKPTAKPSGNSGFVLAPALILSPLSDDVLQEELEIEREHYEQAEKDAQGRVFIMRSYDQGKPTDMTVPREKWDMFKLMFKPDPTDKEKGLAMKYARQMDEEYLEQQQSKPSKTHETEKSKKTSHRG